jgi:hypothetical protein
MRRGGYPLIMGGMGMGMGSPLLTGVMGYMLGRSSNQNTVQQPAQPAPPYPPQYYPTAPAATEAQAAGGDNGSLAQLKLLGQLHDSGTLTDEEFASEKQRILGRA